MTFSSKKAYKTRVLNMQNGAYYKVNTGRNENSKIYSLSFMFLQSSGKCYNFRFDFMWKI